MAEAKRQMVGTDRMTEEMVIMVDAQERVARAGLASVSSHWVRKEIRAAAIVALLAAALEMAECTGPPMTRQPLGQSSRRVSPCIRLG